MGLEFKTFDLRVRGLGAYWLGSQEEAVQELFQVDKAAPKHQNLHFLTARKFRVCNSMLPKIPHHRPQAPKPYKL